MVTHSSEVAEHASRIVRLADGRLDCGGRACGAPARGRGRPMTALLENWRIALGALHANWFRAGLTALGVVIGVAALVAVTAVSATPSRSRGQHQQTRERRGRRRRVHQRRHASVGDRPHDHGRRRRRDLEPADGHGRRAASGHREPRRLGRPVPDEHVARRHDPGLCRRPEPAGPNGPPDLDDRRRLRTQCDRPQLGPRPEALPGPEPDRQDGARGQPRVRGRRRPGPQGEARRREPRQPDLRPAAGRHPRPARRRKRRHLDAVSRAQARHRTGDGRTTPSSEASTTSRPRTPTTSRSRIRRAS